MKTEIAQAINDVTAGLGPYGRPVSGNELHGERMWLVWYVNELNVVAPKFCYGAIDAMTMNRHLRIQEIGPQEREAIAHELVTIRDKQPRDERPEMLPIAAKLWPAPER